MFNEVSKEMEWGGKTLRIETGKIARQADAAVLVTHGETVVLVTAVAAKKPKPGIDFFPLTVNYQEKTFAAGKIPGGFFKREGRPSEKETLVSRLIDRPIRPLFHPKFRNETQVVATVLSHDLETDPDIVAMIGASAALTLSGIPFMGPIGAARVGYVDGEFVLNPDKEVLATSDLDLVVAGTADAVLMVESEAKELSEDVMLGAVMFGHTEFNKVINLIIDLAEVSAKEPWAISEEDTSEMDGKVSELGEAKLREAYGIVIKQDRATRLNEVRGEIMEAFAEEEEAVKGKASSAIKKLEKKIVRRQIVETGGRIDGRTTTDVRQIVSQVGVLPRAHGAALFTRGETQALVTTTLGTSQDEQIIDALDGEYRENFMLHYNFPPYSVGEAGRMGSPGRREIGHGKLAWRALKPLMPTREEFPYTIRVVSEITESNGSSSMASVCGASLAMMDAGVPLPRPVAGIAMGLILEDDGFAVLSDILGDEDHLGDMDFKVAGTSEGVTSLQMDIKIAGITEDIMSKALAQAKDGRAFILDGMKAGINVARDDVKDHAPRITTIKIPENKIREVIGTGGKVIRELCEVTNTKIDIDDDGTIYVAATEAANADDAIKRIKDIVAEAEEGVIYPGKVVKVMDFGAFVNFVGSKDGLVHISELGAERVAQVTDVVNEGDSVFVKCLGFDDRGKVRLSMRVVDQETGADITEQVGEKPARPPRREGEGGDRGRGGDRNRGGRGRRD